MDIDVLALRTQMGLSQTAFAARMGVQQPTVSRWENGADRPSGPARVLLEQMHAGLGQPIDRQSGEPGEAEDPEAEAGEPDQKKREAEKQEPRAA